MSKRLVAFTLMMVAVSLPAICMQSPAAQRGPGGQKVIRDPVEYRAYVNARSIQDPNQRAAAMEAFIHTYPDSVVKIEAMEQAVAAYQQAGNNGKLEEIARRILVLESNNLRALAIITYLERSGPTPSLPGVCLHARRGLQVMAMWQKPENMGEAEFHKLHSQMTAIFYGASGFCSLQEQDFKAARDSYSKAIQIDPANLQNLYQLGVADMEMNPLDLNGLWYIAKAINLAQVQDKTATRENMETYGKAKYRKYHGSEDGWDRLVSEAATQTAPPVNGLEIRNPAQLAVQAVQQNPPDSLSFSDWEFILQFRDVSPANKDAADTVWAAIQARQKGREDKFKIPEVTVISSTADSIDGAITEDNRTANRADVHVVLKRSLLHPLTPGATTDIAGVFTGYTPQPFMLTMEQGELPGMIHSELSEADIEKLLHAGVTPKRATELVKQKGVDFNLDPQAERRLQQAGATDELLLAIAMGRKQ